MNIKDKIIPATRKYTPACLRTIKAPEVAVVLLAVLLLITPATYADPPDNYGGLEQLGAFADKANAERLVKRLEDDGKVAFIVEKTIEGKIFYSVVLDSKPPEIVKDALRVKALSISEAQEEPENGENAGTTLVLPTKGGEPGPSISVLADTTIYSDPEAGAAPLGTYSSLGGASYISTQDGFHTLWLPLINRNGYVLEDDVEKMEFRGHAVPAKEGLPEEDKEKEEYAGPVVKILLPTKTGKPGKSIELWTDTVLYESPSPDAEAIGKYSSIGRGVYDNFQDGFHSIWFESKSIYGYVPPESVHEVGDSPEEP